MEEQQIRQESYATEISQLSDLKNYIGKELGLSGMDNHFTKPNRYFCKELQMTTNGFT